MVPPGAAGQGAEPGPPGAGAVPPAPAAGAGSCVGAGLPARASGRRSRSGGRCW